MNLEPIFDEVQKRMFEKMDALERLSPGPNEMADTTDKLTFDNLATRSPFIKMVSGQTHPITIMGGKLKDDGTMYAGYDMYSPRPYVNTTTSALLPNSEYILGKGTAEQNMALQKAMGADYSKQVGETSEVWNKRRKNAFEMGGSTEGLSTVNKSLRPIPGIKGIDVSFKGGTRAMREATVSWSCWDWDELDMLMPHFLAHGKTVLLEWGWIYGKDSLTRLPSLAAPGGMIMDDAYKDYSGTIKEGKGDYDAMVGVVKNFEFTTRADGGFDCQTIISSVGVNMFENPTPTSNAIVQGTQSNISTKTKLKSVAEKLLKAKDGVDDDNDTLKLDAGVSLKLFISKIDDYIFGQLDGHLGPKKTSNDWGSQHLTKTEVLRWKSNKFLAKIDAYGPKGSVKNAWVQWGWFEDNVLNKFLGMTNKNDEPITIFQSKESVGSVLANVRIRNHEYLETTDINNHILPNQFYPMTPTKFDVDGKPQISDGDSDYLKKLAKIISKNFKPFNAGNMTQEQILNYGKAFGVDPTTGEVGKNRLELANEKGYDTSAAAALIKKSLGGTSDTSIGPVVPPLNFDEEKFYNTKPGKYGYLRHILVNTKIIKEAFGVIDGEQLGVESINIKETLEYMFDLLNQDLDIWNLQITADSKVTNRTKIVDESISAFDFDSVGRENGIKEGHQTLATKGELIGPGRVFYFPTWKSNSFVKSQNITAKIPNAMQMTAMYGSNMDAVKESNNQGSGFSEKSGVVAGALYNDEVDTHKDGIDIGFKNELSKDTSDSVISFIKANVDLLDTGYEARLKKISADIRGAAKRSVDQNLHESEFDSSAPPPLPRHLTKKSLLEILKFESSEEKTKTLFGFKWGEEGELTKFYKSKFETDTDGKEGRLKPQYISTVKYMINEQTENRQQKQDVIVPLELDIDIDGTGGIYPGNSFNSTYIPVKYQKYALFQAFDVSHKVDSSGWTTSISGKMRTTMKLVSDPIDPSTKIALLTDNAVKGAAKASKERAEEKELKKEKIIDRNMKSLMKKGTGTGFF